MIGLEITGSEAVIAKLGEVTGKVRIAAKSSLDAWATELAGYIQSAKLSGQVLNRRTGDLRASVHPVTATDSGTLISAGAAGGAGLKYAKIHEYGGTINHPGGTAYLYKNGVPQFISNAAAAAMPWLLRTGPHNINMPERSYMRSSLREEAPQGIEQLRAAVREAIA